MIGIKYWVLTLVISSGSFADHDIDSTVTWRYLTKQQCEENRDAINKEIRSLKD